jgi:hypothetical protein
MATTAAGTLRRGFVADQEAARFAVAIGAIDADQRQHTDRWPFSVR